MPEPQPVRDNAIQNKENPIDKYFEKLTRYHIFHFAFYFATKFMSVWHTLHILFISPTMKYACSKPGVYNDECPCDNPVWDLSVFTKTIQTKFNVICDEKWKIAFSESLSFFGLLLGGTFFGLLSDKYGRLTSFAICQFIIGAAGLGVVVMPSMTPFMIMRLLEGVGSGGAIVSGFVLCMELCGPKFRALTASILHIPTNLGLAALAVISYFFRDCDTFCIIISVPMLFFVSVICLNVESPKWLLSNNKKEKTIKAMERICRFNKQPTENIRGEIEAYQQQNNKESEKKPKFFDIFKYQRHTKSFLCISVCFFDCGLSYYGVSQYIGKMSPYVHQNTIVNATVLLCGTLICISIVNRIGRRPFLGSSLTFAGMCMVAVCIVPVTFEPSWLRIMFACCASSSFYVSFIIVFLFGVELFPTNIRTSVMGILGLVSRIGQICGPQVNSLPPIVAGGIYACTALLAAFVSCFLPETKGTELPSTLEENQPKINVTPLKSTESTSKNT